MRTLLFLLFIFNFSLIRGFDKTDYDIVIDSESTQNALAKNGLSNTDYLTLSNSVTEMSLISDGHFTIGTKSGISSEILDDACQITFGHPYAMTSYVYFSIDGTNYFPEVYFYGNHKEFSIIGDTLRLLASDGSHIALTIDLIQDDTAGNVQIQCSLENLDSVSHHIGAGIVIDPALGKWGDGFIFYNGVNINQGTVFTSNIRSEIYVNERSQFPFGLKTVLKTPVNLPDQITVDNWADIHLNEQIDSDIIYDGALDYLWNATSVNPGGVVRYRLDLELLNPEFPSGPFMRANLPQIASIENNLLFPRTFTPMIEVYNNSSSGLSGLSLILEGSNYYQEWTASELFSIASHERYFAEAKLVIPEFYENTVLPLNLILYRSEETLDELSQDLFIPAVPFSDTGLVVTIDTLIIDSYPDIDLIFHTAVEQTGGLLLSLGRENIFLYEDQNRIRDFSFGKDTTGGVDEADIIFVLDVTGSMGNEIEDVKNNIIEFSDSLELRGIDYRLGMVTFLDNIENVYDFTSDVQQFHDYIDDQYAHGGGDGPENSLDALMRATAFGFRPAAKRIIIWITDNSYHIADNVTSLTVEEVVNYLLANGIVTHCIGATSYQTDYYDPIINVTGGKYFDIYGNFRDILLEISNLGGTSKYLIRYSSDAAMNTSHEIKLEVHYAGLGGSDVIDFTPVSMLTKNTDYPSLRCYPNPFNPVNYIQIINPTRAEIDLRIFNILGQEVHHYKVAGGKPVVQLQWNARNKQGDIVSNGIYFIRAEINSGTDGPEILPIEKIIYTK